jgi:hypothetical protein
MRKSILKMGFNAFSGLHEGLVLWGGFHQKIPTENVFFRMDETSLRDTFAPNPAILSVWPRK